MAKIHNGFIDKKTTDTFEETALNNVDLTTIKFYRGVKPMWQQLGFVDSNSNVPNNKIYWKNIVPMDYSYFNLSGINTVDVMENDQTTNRKPRTSFVKINIEEENVQIWDEDFLYPKLPKINKFGVFTESVNTDTSYGERPNPPITDEDEIHEDLLLNLDFSEQLADDIVDKTELNKIEYNTDYKVTLDKNLRLEKESPLSFDSLEKDKTKQAF